MHDRPEKTTRAQREEKSKCKQPRETELRRINRRARAAQRERDKRNDTEQHRQTGKAAGLEIFAFRRRPVMQAIAHFFGASGLASGFAWPGLFSAGLVSAGLFSAGF